MFRATISPSSGETTVFKRHLVLIILYGWLSGMQGACTLHTFTPPIHHTTLSHFSFASLTRHYHVCTPWFTSHDRLAGILTNTTLVLAFPNVSAKDQRSPTFPCFYTRQNKYTNTYGSKTPNIQPFPNLRLSPIFGVPTASPSFIFKPLP
jgi:hypothetical protein